MYRLKKPVIKYGKGQRFCWEEMDNEKYASGVLPWQTGWYLSALKQPNRPSKENMSADMYLVNTSQTANPSISLQSLFFLAFLFTVYLEILQKPQMHCHSWSHWEGSTAS